MTPTLQVSHSISLYYKGDKCLYKCKWMIFNNIHNSHVLCIAWLVLNFYALALGKPLGVPWAGWTQCIHVRPHALCLPGPFEGCVFWAKSVVN